MTTRARRLQPGRRRVGAVEPPVERARRTIARSVGRRRPAARPRSVNAVDAECDAECDADVVVLQKRSLEIRRVIAKAKRMVTGGQTVVRERFFATSSRNWTLVGARRPGTSANGSTSPGT